MTREEFASGFIARMRDVIQKHERVADAQNTLHKNIKYAPSDTAAHDWQRLVVRDAQNDLDATLVEVAYHVWDASFHAYRDYVRRENVAAAQSKPPKKDFNKGEWPHP